MKLPELVMLDANIPIYASGREHEYRLPCLQLLERAAAGEINAATNVEVHQEILHYYLRQGLGTRGREVSKDFQIVVPTVLPVTIQDIARMRDLSADYPELPTRDLLHLAVMLNNNLKTIITADRHFDSVEGIQRLDPTAVTARS